jgi:hypothetical protein
MRSNTPNVIIESDYFNHNLNKLRTKPGRIFGLYGIGPSAYLDAIVLEKRNG